jgi:hypothetical protein
MMKSVFVVAALLLVPLAVQAEPKSVLAPVEGLVRAVVHHAQPTASFATGPDIFLAQYHTANHVYQPRDAGGHPMPPQVQLGPRPDGGFYLQLDIAKAEGTDAVQTTPASKEQPWTTVISTYLLPDKKMIVMTWEATHGAPRGLAAHIRAVLLHYAAHANR